MSRSSSFALALSACLSLVVSCTTGQQGPGAADGSPSPAPVQTATAGLPCGAETPPWAAVEDREAWLDGAVNYQVTYRDGQVSGEAGPHEVEWGRLIQLTVRSDTGSRLDIEASGREGIVSENGTATFAFPAEPTGRVEVVMRETGATLLALEVSCPT